MVTPYIGGAAQTPINTNSAATTYTVTGLTNGTSYTFTVAAQNNMGSGPASAPSSSAIPNVVPGAPGTPSGTPGNHQVALSWTAPTPNGGTAITDYLVAQFSAEGRLQRTIDTGSASSSPVVTGLANGFGYRFAVTAVNQMGGGPPSAQSSPTTPATVPDAPTSVSATNAGNGAVFVSWTGPSNTGGTPINSYSITPSSPVPPKPQSRQEAHDPTSRRPALPVAWRTRSPSRLSTLLAPGHRQWLLVPSRLTPYRMLQVPRPGWRGTARSA